MRINELAVNVTRVDLVMCDIKNFQYDKKLWLGIKDFHGLFPVVGSVFK